MTSTKYIGMDVHKESISIQVMNSVGKVVMESVIETKASTILPITGRTIKAEATIMDDRPIPTRQ